MLVLLILYFTLYFAIAPSWGSPEAYFMLASIKEVEGDYSEAAKLYKKVIRKIPKEKELYRYLCYNLGELSLKEGNLRKARIYYKRSLPLPHSFVKLAELYLYSSKFKEASRIIEEGLKNTPSELRARLLFLGAQVYTKLAQLKKAIQFYTEILRDNPQNIKVTLELAELLTKEGNLSEAKKLLEKLLKYYKNEPEILYLLAKIYQKEEKYAKAEGLFLLLTKICPQAGVAEENLVSIYLIQGELEKALHYIEELDKNTYIYWWFKAIYSEKKKEIKSAKYAYHKVIELASDFTPPYIALTYIALEEKNIEEAEKIIWKAKERLEYPFEEEAFSAWGEVLIQTALRAPSPQIYREKLNLALYTLSSGIKRYKDSPILHFLRGVVKERLGLFNSAISDFYKCIGEDPSFSAAYNYIGYMYAERSINLEEAEELIKKALEIKNDFPAYLDSLAWVYFKKGKLKEAKEILQDAVKKEEDPVIREHLGDVYYALGEKDKAKLEWEKSVILWDARYKELPQDFIANLKKIKNLKRKIRK